MYESFPPSRSRLIFDDEHRSRSATSGSVRNTGVGISFLSSTAVAFSAVAGTRIRAFDAQNRQMRAV